MYDSNLLQERMAELNFNFNRLAAAAGVDGKTAKSFVTTGKGNPDTVEKVSRVLQFKIKDLVIRRRPGKRKSA